MQAKFKKAKNKIKKSFYSFFIPKDNGGYIIFNSLTGVIIEVYAEDNIAQSKEIISKDTMDYDEKDEILNCFYKKGILVEENKDEYEVLLKLMINIERVLIKKEVSSK